MKKLLSILLLLISFNVFADTVNVNWTSPAGINGRVDNSELLASDIQGYKIYITPISEAGVTESIIINDPLALAHSFERTESGEYSLNMTTIDTDGRESSYSNDVPISIGSNPNPPGGVNTTVVITITIGVEN